MYVCVDVCAMRDGRVLCPMPKSVPRLRPAMSRQSVSGVCICAYAYAYAYARARVLALPVRVCIPHLSCLLCSALSSHVPCSYDMSAHARAHAALGADMHMCMGACPAGVVVRSPTASYPISLSDSRGFGSFVYNQASSVPIPSTDLVGCELQLHNQFKLLLSLLITPLCNLLVQFYR